MELKLTFLEMGKWVKLIVWKHFSCNSHVLCPLIGFVIIVSVSVTFTLQPLYICKVISGITWEDTKNKHILGASLVPAVRWNNYSLGHSIPNIRMGHLCGLAVASWFCPLPPVFESRCGHIWRLFHLWLGFITFAGHSAHLAYIVHKSE